MTQKITKRLIEIQALTKVLYPEKSDISFSEKENKIVKAINYLEIAPNTRSN